MNAIDACYQMYKDIEKMITEKIKTIRYDRTFRAKITSQISANKYKILYKNKEYPASCDIKAKIGDIVWVCAPRNNWDELYVQICSSFSLDNYFPLSGGTINGSSQFNDEVITKRGHRVHSVGATSSGLSGYVGICRITIKNAYANQAIRFKVIQRGKDGGEITIRFNNLNGNDPTLATFKVYQDLTQVQIVKTSTSTWDLYIQKSEAYDSIDVVDVQIGSYMTNKLVIDWTDNFNSINPGGTIATVVS
ncbi:hypothetical protein K413DRAFT_4761 [Clostridium sp. ASBs410]|nr:hypothetical protein K413DRAFT_4761 [Clostridium sp. ASBs410]